jgi:hypothetical protein
MQKKRVSVLEEQRVFPYQEAYFLEGIFTSGSTYFLAICWWKSKVSGLVRRMPTVADN